MSADKHLYHTIFIALALILTLAGSAPAQDAHSGHSMGMNESTTTGNSTQQDMTTIRETMVDNHHLVYHLIDMQAGKKDLEKMPPMGNTHHLMVYIHSPDGQAVENARTGFLITSPDGEKQKAMAMAMSGGYGADINLKTKGTYTISVKAVTGDADLRDSFEYEIK